MKNRIPLVLLDKLAVGFLYLNVLVPAVGVAGISLSKVAFALMLAVYAVIALREKPHARALAYIVVALTGMLLLTVISWAKGNELRSIASVGSLVMIVLAIPPLQLLFHHYGGAHYLRHGTHAIVALGVLYLGLNVVCGPLNQRQVAELITSPGSPFATTMSFAFFPGGLRVAMTNLGFLPAGLLLVYFRVLDRGAWRDLLAFLVLGAAVYLSYMVSLWVSSALGVAAATLLLGLTRLWRPAPAPAAPPRLSASFGAGNRRKHLVALFLAAGMAFAFTRLPGFILESKRESFNFKHQQLQEAVAEFRSAPLTGKGLGFLYRRSEFLTVSAEASPLLENSYAVILASTGLLGVLVFGFIYLYYPFRLLRAEPTPLMVVLGIAHGMVLIQAWGNPFLWSGGLGLLFSCLLAAAVENAPDDPARPPRPPS